jgi:RimJ/RimL family protein N-acetyltransferase
MLRPTYPLRTDRLLLRAFADEDLDAVHALHSREDVTRYLYWGPLSRDEARELLERRKARRAIDGRSDALNVAAVLPDSGALVGEFSLGRLSATHRQGEIGFVIHPDYQGRGYATEGAALMLRLGFESLGLHRMVGRCDARNARSVAVMARLGMRREAHLRDNEFVKGEWCDELVYAMLEEEWRASPR